MDPQVEDQQQQEIIVLKVRASLLTLAFTYLTLL